MNKARRKKLEKVCKLIEQAKDMLEEVSDDEREAYNNLPESFLYSEMGETMESSIEQMDEAYENLESACSSLEEI